MQPVTLSPRARAALMRAIEVARAAGRQNDADAIASLLAELERHRRYGTEIISVADHEEVES